MVSCTALWIVRTFCTHFPMSLMTEGQWHSWSWCFACVLLGFSQPLLQMRPRGNWNCILWQVLCFCSDSTYSVRMSVLDMQVWLMQKNARTLHPFFYQNWCMNWEKRRNSTNLRGGNAFVGIGLRKSIHGALTPVLRISTNGKHLQLKKLILLRFITEPGAGGEIHCRKVGKILVWAIKKSCHFHLYTWLQNALTTESRVFPSESSLQKCLS